MVIRASDRVSEVLARDERFVEVFASLAPTFEKLRNPGMRKVMARLVTVEQAARIAGIEPEYLVEQLNLALERDAPQLSAAPVAVGEGRTTETELTGPRTTPDAATSSGSPPSPREPGDPTTPSAELGRPPANLASVPSELIIDLDVRPELRRGEEPFSKIMAARREVPSGGVLRLRATFEPVPLYAVLGRQGLEHWTERFADDDWRVWFYDPTNLATITPAVPPVDAEVVAGEPTAVPGPGPSPSTADSTVQPAHPGTPAAAPAAPADDVVFLDVRGLEPPEPMMRTFEVLERLPRGKTLVQLNVRVPQFLLPQLEARGFTYEIREESRDLVRIFIRHAGEV